MNLWHCRSVGLFSLLFKMFKNSTLPLHASMPEICQQAHVTTYAVNANSKDFSPKESELCSTQSLIQATNNMWNELPNEVTESEELQEF